MPGWDDILFEIQRSPNSQDFVRQKYLSQLSEHTNRNVISYYSGWLSKPDAASSDINDNDINGFMNAVRGMDTSLGLDLLLHTPGGQPTAAESIVKYLRSKFGSNIRMIVPQLAMSAGTMIACAGNIIVMGKQSSLGPIDPQFNGIPAFSVRKEFEEAKTDLFAHPEHFHYWKILLEKYPVAFVNAAIDAIDLSSVLLREWLSSCMFTENTPEITRVIDSIVQALNDHDDSKSHARHYNVDFCQSIGLKIFPLESDQTLQDLILSVHHSYNHTFSTTSAIKIIENHMGKAMVMHAAPR